MAKFLFTILSASVQVVSLYYGTAYQRKTRLHGLCNGIEAFKLELSLKAHLFIKFAVMSLAIIQIRMTIVKSTGMLPVQFAVLYYTM